MPGVLPDEGRYRRKTLEKEDHVKTQREDHVEGRPRGRKTAWKKDH